MVAITVILAAVIAAFVFGMGPPKQAPVASIRLMSSDVTANELRLEHQGGADLTLSDVKLVVDFKSNAGLVTRMSLDKVDTTSPSGKLTPGDTLEIVADGLAGTLNKVTPSTLALGTATGPVTLAAGGEATVTLVDVPSGQQIAQGKIRT